MKFKFTRNLLIVFLVALLGISLIPDFASASPVQEQRRKAQEIANKIEANGEKISELAEKYNETKLRLDRVKESLTQAQSELEKAQQRNKEVRTRVQKRAVSLYTSNSSKDAVAESKVNNIRKEKYADIASGIDSSILLELEITTEEVNERKAQLDVQLQSVENEEKELAAKKREIEAANAEQQRLLNQTQGELNRLVQQERERRSRAASAPSASSSSSRASNVALPGNLPAPSPKAAIAIEYARQQLGKPYKYAATGPDSFDCSGLTMRAWGAAGVSMPHFSGAQYNMFPKVPLNALAPGDLVYRPGHIGLYIGNGLMIHAPQTGDVVKIAPTGRLTGASRPG